MKNLANILGRAALGVAALLSVACQRDPVPAPPVQGPVGNRDGYVSIPVSIGQAPIVQTKGAMLNDPAVESVGSGAIILVYMDGLLTSQYYFSQAEIDNQGSTPLMIEAPLGVCDFYILGNLNAIHKTSGDRASLLDVLSESDLANEATLETLSYRLDGGDIPSSGYRRQTMAEVCTYGLPYRHVVKNVNTGLTTGIPGSNSCKRLFSKVTVIIDHSAFDGGIAGNVDYFVNKNIYMRQVNARLMPFSDTAVKATESADLVAGAYDDAMSNAGLGTYVFYVPENMQGIVSGITKQEDKTASNIPSAMASYATYVEFTGTLDKAAGGFGGDVTYKFFLGANNTTDFNVERGKNYEVTLGFTADGLFNPYWKVNASLTDSRLFALTADASGATDIGNVNASRNLLVRKNRPGAMYVYMNRDGDYGASNALLGKEYATSESMAVSSLSDCSWYGAMMVSSTEDATWLSARGITPDWDAANAKLSFTVTDPSKFNAHLGESRFLSAKLLPNGQAATFHLVLAEDMVVTVADGLSLTNDFYMGQKRTVSVSGFQGTNVKYAAVQEQCGASSSSAKNSNVQWKAVNTGDFENGYPSCAVDGNGDVVLNPANAAYADQNFTGSLDVYAWYPNRFQSSHAWGSKDGKIVIFSDDWLNDRIDVDLRILEPRVNLKIASWYDPDNSTVGIDGTANTTLGCALSDYNGSTYLGLTNFDETLFNKLLKPVKELTPSSSSLAWVDNCFDFKDAGLSGSVTWSTMPGSSEIVPSAANICLVVANTKFGSNVLEDLPYDVDETGSSLLPYDHHAQRVTVGSVVLSGNPTTHLFDGLSETKNIRIGHPSFRPDHSGPTIDRDYQSADIYASMRFYGIPVKTTRIRNDYRYVFPYFNFLKNKETGDIQTVAPSLYVDLSIWSSYCACMEENYTVTHTNDYNISYTAKNGTVIKPYYDLKKKETDNYYWEWSPGMQTKWAGSEYTPAELMAPIGLHHFNLECTNINDHRTFTVDSQEFLVSVGEPTSVDLFVRNGDDKDDLRIYIVTQRAAKVLLEYGHLMTPAGREFARKVVGYDYFNDYDENDFPSFYHGDFGPETAEIPYAIAHAENPSQTKNLPGYNKKGNLYNNNNNKIDLTTITDVPFFSWGISMLTNRLWLGHLSSNVYYYRHAFLGEKSYTTSSHRRGYINNEYIGNGTLPISNLNIGYENVYFLDSGIINNYQYNRAVLDLSSTDQHFSDYVQ